MAFWNSHTLRGKLRLTNLESSALALLFASIAFLLAELITYHYQIRSEGRALTDLIGLNVSAPVVFRNQPAAAEVLSTLQAKSGVVSAYVLNGEGEIFASYHPMPETRRAVLESAARNDSVFAEGRLYVFSDILAGGERVGVTAIAFSLEGLTDALVRALSTTIMVFLAAVLISHVLSGRLLQTILEPIERFAAAMRRVGEQRDYSVRLPEPSHQELSQMFQGFNEMLERIEQQEAMLAESEERYRSIVETQIEYVCRLDADLRIEFANRAFLDLTSMTAEQATGKSIAVVFIDADYETLSQDLAPLTPQDSSVSLQHRANLGGEIQWLQSTVSALFDADGNLREYLIVGQDITDRKLAEERSVQMAKLATLGEMATGMAHELNQPLSVIGMVAQNVSELVDEGEDIDRAYLRGKLDRIYTNVQRIRSIIDHLRIFGRKVGDESEAFDVHRTIESALMLMQHRMRLERVKIDYHKPESVPLVRGHPILFEQVLLNLLSNAADAIYERCGEGAERRIEIELKELPQRRKVVCIVEDTGGGIAEQLRERIFEPFFTTKPVGRGTGMGLSISYGIIRDMGGSLEATEGRRGARMKITLPAIKAKTKSKTKAKGAVS